MISIVHMEKNIYNYKKFMKLKKEIDSIMNTYNKLNLFNKSLFASLQQKSKDCQYLMKENSILKKAILKLNGLTYKKLIKNKIKDFKMNKKINANKFIYKTEYLNNNNININININIECRSSYISKKAKQKEMNKNNYNTNYPSIHNTINDNKKISNSSIVSSHNSDNSDNSFFNKIKKKNINNKTYYKKKVIVAVKIIH